MYTITYGNQIWVAATKMLINKVQTIQNKFFHIILNKFQGTSMRELQTAKIRTMINFIAHSAYECSPQTHS